MSVAKIVALIAVLPSLALAEPGYYRVVGVASDDTLNVRAAPDGSSDDIGDLSYNAEGIEVMALDASGRWGKIGYFEGNAWVAMRFLEPDPRARFGATSLPVGLRCGGTEPFWDIQFDATGAAFSDMGSDPLPLDLLQAGYAASRLGYPALLTHSGSGGFTYSLIRPEICSDGMSDRDYPWRIDFILDGGAYLEGCCTLPLNDM